jgi:hypothetical protein
VDRFIDGKKDNNYQGINIVSSFNAFHGGDVIGVVGASRLS